MDKYQTLETLYQQSSFIQFYLNSAETEESRKEWTDKAAAKQKEIDLILNPR